MPRAVDVEVVDVWRGPELAGRLARTRTGAEFVYDDAFLERRAAGETGIAFRLRSDQRRYTTTGVNLHPFFAGLLPEGLRLSVVVRRAKTSPDDLFSILVAVGSDCIGDVAVTPAGQALAPPLGVADVAKIDGEDFDELLRRTLATGVEAIEDVGIPGVQEKVSASMISFPLRGRSTAGAWILKLNPPDRPLLVENEAFCLRMARDCGLKANDAKLVHDRHGRSGLLVERFDRIHDVKARETVKAHQEDACQFLDRYPADKYRVPARDIAEGVAAFASAPVVEILRFLELYAFSYLIGNGDLHAKNVSLLRSPRTGLVELSPAYDLLTTLAYRGLDQRMAIRLDAKDDGFRSKDFVAFGERHGVRAAATTAMLDRLVNRSEPWIERFDEVGWAAADCDRVKRGVRARRKHLAGVRKSTRED